LSRRGASRTVEQVEELLRDLAQDDGYVHVGGPGAGHYVKIIHNGILYGMLQAIGEGAAMITRFPEEIDLQAVVKTWNSGGVISSALLGNLHDALSEQAGTLSEVPPYVEDTGEVAWVLADALSMEVPVPVIAAAQMALFENRDSDEAWARAIAAMRHAFGGHPYGPDERVAEERSNSRVGSYVR
jgi:6-phosphogluconate dehydrogenase